MIHMIMNEIEFGEVTVSEVIIKTPTGATLIHERFKPINLMTGDSFDFTVNNVGKPLSFRHLRKIDRLTKQRDQARERAQKNYRKVKELQKQLDDILG